MSCSSLFFPVFSLIILIVVCAPSSRPHLSLLALPSVSSYFESRRGASLFPSSWNTAQGQPKWSRMHKSWQLLISPASLFDSLSLTLCFSLSSRLSLLLCWLSPLHCLLDSLFRCLNLSSTSSLFLTFCLSSPRHSPLAPQSAQIHLVSVCLRAWGCGYWLHCTVFPIWTQINILTRPLQRFYLLCLQNPIDLVSPWGSIFHFFPFSHECRTFSVWFKASQGYELKPQMLFLVDFVSSLFHHRFIILNVDMTACLGGYSLEQWKVYVVFFPPSSRWR